MATTIILCPGCPVISAIVSLKSNYTDWSPGSQTKLGSRKTDKKGGKPCLPVIPSSKLHWQQGISPFFGALTRTIGQLGHCSALLTILTTDSKIIKKNHSCFECIILITIYTIKSDCFFSSNIVKLSIKETFEIPYSPTFPPTFLTTYPVGR